MSSSFELSAKQKKFVESEADFTVFGGAAGSGSTFGLLKTFDTNDHSSRGVLLTDSLPRICASGGLFDTALSLYDKEVMEFSNRERFIRFCSGAELKFMTTEMFNSTKMKFSYIGIEQVQELDLVTFSRILNSREDCGKVYATVLPDKDSFIFELIRDSLDAEGVPVQEDILLNKTFALSKDKILVERTIDLFSRRFKTIDKGDVMSFKFIPANVFDNVHMERSYVTGLQALPSHLRNKFLSGSWF